MTSIGIINNDTPKHLHLVPGALESEDDSPLAAQASEQATMQVCCSKRYLEPPAGIPGRMC